MNIYSGYPRRHSKMITGVDMKIINRIVTDNRISNLDFNSEDEFKTGLLPELCEI